LFEAVRICEDDMRKYLTIMMIAGLMGSVATTAQAAVGQDLSAAASALNPIEKAGCYRWGETGYHWYGFCVGPRFLYPHHRVCRHGYCYVR
jgi:ribosomal protein L2